LYVEILAIRGMDWLRKKGRVNCIETTAARRGNFSRKPATGGSW